MRLQLGGFLLNDLHRRRLHFAASIHLLIKPMLRCLFHCKDACNDCAADELEVDEYLAFMKKMRLSSVPTLGTVSR